MNWVLAALGIWLAGGLAAWMAGRRPGLSASLCLGSLCLGALCFAGPVAGALWSAPLEWRQSWAFPGGDLVLHLDALAAWFLLPALFLSLAGAWYGKGYWSGHGHAYPGGKAWFFYNLLTGAIAVVLLAGNALLFLAAWEVMAVASFFLVLCHHQEENVRRAGWVYLLATHLGAAPLLALFLLAGTRTGSLEFAAWAAAPEAWAGIGGLALCLALVGFGSKAGLFPFHVWLPEAHPAAPSHVSALLSGIMLKTGLYGLLRFTSLLPAPPDWWPWTLIALGSVSGMYGILYAMAQRDLKRFLAYSSMENIGILFLGFGLSELGRLHGNPAWSALAWMGCLWHVWNHALGKGVLFLSAGSVLHTTGTVDMERLGGLSRRMPWTSRTFLVGAAALCGIPPLNGFWSELALLGAALLAIVQSPGSPMLAGMLVLGSLAWMGGLAVAAFARSAGVVFLGEPRSESLADGGSESPLLRGPLILLASACLLLSLIGPAILNPLAKVMESRRPSFTTLEFPFRAELQQRLFFAWTGLVILVFFILALALLRRRLLSRRTVESSVTWDCGYARPAAGMQYTAGSFSQPATSVLVPVVDLRREGDPPRGIFPVPARLQAHIADPLLQRFYRPVLIAIARLPERLHWLQHGNLHLYVLYVAATLIFLLFWLMD